MKLLSQMLLGALLCVGVIFAGFLTTEVAMARDHSWGPHIAVSAHGDVGYYAEGQDEEDARGQAMFLCQREHGRNACLRAISVPDDWWIALVVCDNGRRGSANRVRPFVAASEYDKDQAIDNALQKVRNVGSPWRTNNCWVVNTW